MQLLRPTVVVCSLLLIAFLPTTTSAAHPKATGQPNSEPEIHSRLWNVKDTKSALRLVVINFALGKNGADTNALLAQARTLFDEPVPPPAAFADKNQLRKLLLFTHLPKTKQSLLEMMNLMRILEQFDANGKVRDAQKLQALLKQQKALVQATLLLNGNEDADALLANPKRLWQRIRGLDRFHKCLLGGFHPLKGPGREQILEYLRQGGIPDLPLKLSEARKVTKTLPDNRKIIYWGVDLELSFGINKPYRLKGFPIGNADGFLLNPADIPINLNKRLNDLAKENLTLPLWAGGSVQLQKLQVSNQQLLADVTVALPGIANNNPKLVITDLSPAFKDGQLNWTVQLPKAWEYDLGKAFDLKIPESLSDHFQFDRNTGKLKFTGIPTIKEIDELQQLIVKAKFAEFPNPLNDWIMKDLDTRVIPGKVIQVGKHLQPLFPKNVELYLDYNPGTGALTVKKTPTAEIRAILRQNAEQWLRDTLDWEYVQEKLYALAPRLDLKEWVELAKIAGNKLPLGDIRIDTFRRRYVDRRHTEAYRQAIKKWKTDLWQAKDEKVREFLDNILAANPVPNPKGLIAEFDVAVEVAGQRCIVGPIGVDRSGALVNLPVRLALVKTNREILQKFIQQHVPFWSELSGEDANILIRDANLNISPAELQLTVVWRTEYFAEPVTLDVHASLKDGVKIDWEKALRQGLAGKTVTLGPLMSVTLANDLAEQKGWPGVIRVGETKLGLTLNHQNGNWSAEVDSKNLEKLVVGKIREISGDVKIKIEKTALNLPKVKANAKVAKSAFLAFEVAVGEENPLHLTVRLDRRGVRFDNWEAAVAQLVASKLKEATSGWPIRISHVSRRGNGYLVDAEFLVKNEPVIFLVGAKFTKQGLRGGSVRVAPGAIPAWVKNRKLSGAGWSIQLLRLGLDDQRRVNGDIEVTFDELDKIVLKDVPLTPSQTSDFQRFVPRIWQVLQRKWKGGHTVELGPWQVRITPKAGAQPAFDVKASCPSLPLELSVENVTFSFKKGFSGGRVQVKEQLLQKLKTKLTGFVKERLPTFDFDNVPLDFPNIVLDAEQLNQIRLRFDVELTVADRKLTIRENHLGRDGLKLGKLPDLSGLKKALARKALDKFSTWVKGKKITLGPLVQLEVLDVDGEAKTATAAVSVYNKPAGKLTAKFAGNTPDIKWVDVPKLQECIAELPGIGWVFQLSQDRVKITAARFRNRKIELDFSVRPAPLAEGFFPVGTVELGKEGVSFRPDENWEPRLWTLVAGKLQNFDWRPEDLPIRLRITKAVADASGVTCSAEGTINGLGTMTATGIRIRRNGITWDKQAAMTSVANLVAQKLQDLLSDADSFVKSVKLENNAIAIRMEVDLGLEEKIDLAIRIDAEGKVHGLDEKLVVQNLLNRLASELKGKELSLPGGILLKIDDAPKVLADLSGISLNGTAKLDDLLEISVRNVIFTGKSFKTDKMEVKIQNAKILSEVLDLGLSDVAPLTISNISPILKGGDFHGVSVQTTLTIKELLQAKITAEISRDGVSIDLPIQLTAEGLHVPVPPCFKLSKWRAELARTHIGVGCSLSLTPPGTEKLIRVDGKLTFPLKRPIIVRADGDLVILSIFKPGHSEVVLDFEKQEFRAATVLAIPKVLDFETTLLARLRPDDLLFEGRGHLVFLGARLANGYIRIDKVGLMGSAEIRLLAATAKASLECKWQDPLDLTATAEVGFDLPVVGRVLGADVEGNPKRGVEFGATIIGQRIRLLAVDYEGITRERILDLLFRDRIIPTGLKLFADDGGGGGGVIVTKGGTMVKFHKNKQGQATGEASVLYKAQGGYVYRHISPAEGGGGGSEEEWIAPHLNQKTKIVRAADGTIKKRTDAKVYANVRNTEQIDSNLITRPLEDVLFPKLQKP